MECVYLVYGDLMPIYPSCRIETSLLKVFLDLESAEGFIKSCKTELKDLDFWSNEKYKYKESNYKNIYIKTMGVG